MAEDGSPALLQIVREPIRPGRDEAYAAIEDEIARACVVLRCPHPHVALQPLGGPPEVWWLNAFASEEDRQRVERAYRSNHALMAILERLGARKAEQTGPVIDVVTRFRGDLSRGPAWSLRGARAVVVALSSHDVIADGSVFEDPAGTRYVLRAAATAEQAEAGARSLDLDARVLAVQPRWGFPARTWVDADPGFWRSNPMCGGSHPPDGP